MLDFFVKMAMFSIMEIYQKTKELFHDYIR